MKLINETIEMFMKFLLIQSRMINFLFDKLNCTGFLILPIIKAPGIPDEMEKCLDKN